MDGCGLACVIFIWVGFLWPVLVTFAFMAIKGASITRKGKYFIASVLVGYLLYVVGNTFAAWLARSLIDTIQPVATSIFFVTALLLCVPPVISTYLIAKRYS